MLKELTAVISDDDTNIRNIDIRHDDNGEAIIEFIVEAEDVRHLNRMVLGSAPRQRRPRRTAHPKNLVDLALLWAQFSPVIVLALLLAAASLRIATETPRVACWLLVAFPSFLCLAYLRDLAQGSSLSALRPL